MIMKIDAISAENLQSLAAKTSDPEVLLGIAYLVHEESAIRREISEAAAKARPEYAPIVKVLAVAVDRADEQSVGELIESDPDNALGFYLQAHLLHESDKKDESLDAFREATTCPALRLYGTTTANALFKALDALNIQGRDRLEVLCWTASRVSNLCSYYFQHLNTDLNELAHKADLATRKEISDLLFIIAGHLFETNFTNRLFAEWTIQASCRLKAQIAAEEKSLTANGYVTITHAMMRRNWSCPDALEQRHSPLEVARFVPGRILMAIRIIDPSRNVRLITQTAKVPESDKAAFEKAEQGLLEASAALVDVALTDPDGIIGAYLKDLPPPNENSSYTWVSDLSYVERLIYKRPELFKAAVANEKAMDVLNRAGYSDPNRQNVHKLMAVGSAIFCYMANNDENLPDNLEVLYKDGEYLKDASAVQSVLTGKPYVFAAAGAKLPDKHSERHQFILVYDFIEKEGCYHFVTSVGSGAERPAEKFEELLRKQSKS